MRTIKMLTVYMNESEIKPLIIIIAVCLGIGVIAQLVADWYWLGTGFLLFSGLMFQGLLADGDTRMEGGFYDASSDTEAQKESYAKAVRSHKLLITGSLICGILAFYLKYS